MREISDRSPQPGAVRTPPSNPPPIVEPSALRPRSSNPPAVTDADIIDEPPVPSIPPDAIVPAAASGEEPVAPHASAPEAPVAQAHASPAGEPTPAGGFVAAPPPLPRLPWEDPEPQPEPAPAGPPPGETVSPTVLEAGPPSAPPPVDDTAVEAPFSSPFAVTQPMAAVPPRLDQTLPLAAAAPAWTGAPTAAPGAAPAEPAPEIAPAAPRRAAWPYLLALIALGLAVAAVLRLTAGGDAPQVTAPVPPSASAASTPAPAPCSSPGPSTAPSASAPAASASGATGDELPPGAEVPPGFGLVEVAAPAGARVRIDGAIAGTGPAVSLVAAPGYHEVRIEQDGGDVKQVVEVRSAKTTRVKSAPQPVTP
jgi:hypothetical protein